MTSQTAVQPTINLSFDHTRLVEGALFSEASYGMLHKYRVTKSAEVIDADLKGYKALRWYAEPVVKQNEDEEACMFYITEKHEHYGPKIYFEEEIIKINGRKFLAR